MSGYGERGQEKEGMFGRSEHVRVEHFPATVLDIGIITLIGRQLPLIVSSDSYARVEREILEDGVVDDEGHHPLGRQNPSGPTVRNSTTSSEFTRLYRWIGRVSCANSLFE